MKPHVVRLSSIYLWVNYLFTLHREDFEGEIEFLLEMGMDGVVLSVLSRLRAQARHTGVDIHGQIIEPEALAARLEQPLRGKIVDPATALPLSLSPSSALPLPKLSP